MTEPHSWLQIALEVEPELAEAVAEALVRYLPDGVAIESTAIEANDEDEGRATGPLRVVGYIPVDGELEHTRLQIQQALRYLALIQPLPEPIYTPIQQTNWMEAWKQHYRPIEVGERLLILPAWAEDAPGARLPVRIDPGMAFGTGVHPTTQLSLQLIERYLQPGEDVIDVGCGSGVLSIAAAKLGAGRLLGVDIEADAIENSRHNATLNQVVAEFAVGSLDDILAGQFALKQAPLVVANILAPILVRLLDGGLARLLAPGGRLLVSGILDRQHGDILEAIARAWLREMDWIQMGDWLGLAASRAS
jgi:ribosomal protein L11 methyltransferase